MYVWYPILLNATGVIIITWRVSENTRGEYGRILVIKFNNQFLDVERALAGAQIRRGTISVAYQPP
jgi:hypothetical protein